MKLMKKLLIASAIGMAFAGQAQALTSGTVSNGSLYLAVWDSNANGTGYSYAQDLGYTINSFLPNGNATVSAADGGPIAGDKTPAAGMNLAFNTGVLSGFTGNVADLRWNVVAFDNNAANSPMANTKRLVTTTQVGTTNAGNISNTGLNTVTTNVGTTANFYGASCGAAGCSSLSTSAGWAGSNTFGNTLGYAGLSTSQSLGNTLEMMYITQTGTNPGAATTAGFDFFDNAYGRAVWSLTSAGQLTYSIAGAPVSEVPVPAALWLFGSGLLGLVGIGRRKSVAAA